MLQRDLLRRRSLRGAVGVLTIAGLAASAAIRHRATASASVFYHAGQQALVRHDLTTAAADFQQAVDLTNEPDKRAWAQYQLAACYEAQPSSRAQAIAALRSLIHDEPRHFLAARAKSDLDRLQTPLNPPASGGRLSPSPLAGRAGVGSPLDVDCGPEALAYILRHSFNRPASLSTLRHLAGTDAHGTTLLGLQIAAAKCGLSAVGMKADMNYLRRMRPPAILWIRRCHFIAFLGTKPPFWKFRVYDPAGTREEVLTPEELQTMWDGYLLKLSVPAPGTTP